MGAELSVLAPAPHRKSAGSDITAAHGSKLGAKTKGASLRKYLALFADI